MTLSRSLHLREVKGAVLVRVVGLDRGGGALRGRERLTGRKTAPSTPAS
jgi:hypothetical protein